MSSRLFIARIIPMLLLLLGVFGTAVADTGGGSPKKVKGTALNVNDISVTNGGSTSGTVICANGQTIVLEPSLSNLSSTSSVSFTILRGTDLPIVLTSNAVPFTVNYVATGVSGITSFTVIARDNSSNPSTFSKVFSLVPPATNVVTASSSSICEGSSLTFTQSASDNLTLLASAGITGVTGTTSVVSTPSATGPQTFSFTGIDTPTGCAYSSTVAVNIVAKPTATIVAYPNPVCAGQTVSFSLTQSGVTSATATIAGGAATVGASPGFISTSATSGSGTFATSYTVVNSSGCTVVATPVNFTVVALPTNGPSVSLVTSGVVAGTANATSAPATVTGATASTGSFSVCQNSSLVLSLSGCDTSNGSGSPASTSGSVTVSPGYVIVTTSTGTATVANGITSYELSTSAVGTGGYQIACVNSFGCSSTSVASFTLTVLPTPVAPTLAGGITGGQNVPLCSNQVLSFTATCPTGTTVGISSTTGIVTYSPTSSTANTQVFSVTASSVTSVATQSYAVSCSSLSCVSPATNYTLTVNPLPANGPFVSAAYSTSGGSTITTINATTASSSSAITVCQNSTLMLSVTGCTTNDPNTPSTNPITVIAPGGSVGVGATVLTPGGPGVGTYLISTSALSTSLTGPYVYTIVCTNSAGCSSTAIASLSVTVNPSPELASITAVNGTPANVAVAGGSTGAVAICQSSSPLIVNTNCLVTPGGSLTASGSAISSASAVGVGVGVSTTATSATFVSFSVSAATAGTFSYSFVCINSSGCPSLTPTILTVTVNSSVAAPTTPSGVTTVCQNSPNVTFSLGCATGTTALVDAFPSSAASSSSLSGNSLVIGTATSGTFVYGVRCQSAAGCISGRTSYTLVVNPQPITPTLTVTGGSVSPVMVAAGGSNSVSICQGNTAPSVLTVVTSCEITPGSSGNAAANQVGGTATGGGVGFANSTSLAIGGGSSTTSTSPVFATFTISTASTGQFSYTFACQTAGCVSASVTTLAVTVSGSVAAPTTPSGVTTVCQNSPNVTFSLGCATGATALVDRFPSSAASSSSLSGNSLVIGTATSGTFVYGVRCQSAAGCISERTSYTLVVNPQPITPTLTVTGGSVSPVMVAAGGSNSVSICQGNTAPSVLTVVTSCEITPGSSGNAAANQVGGVNSGGGVGFANSTSLAIGVGSSTTSTSPVFATFTISTASTGDFTYTFACQTAGCVSASVTTLAVTVSGSVAAPTTPSGVTTVCQNSPNVTFSLGCATGATALVDRFPSSAASSSSLSGNSLVIGTATSGTFVYGVRCQSAAGCISERTSYTLVVNPQPITPTLTVTGGSVSPVMVAAGGSNSVSICQGNTAPSVLTVVTSCEITPGSSGNAAANQVGGVNSGGGVGFANSTSLAIGVGSSTTSTSPVFATFTISTASTGDFTYTFACQTAGCVSASVTTLAVTVSGSVAAPTTAGSTTVCQNSGVVSIATGCGSNSAIIVSSPASLPSSGMLSGNSLMIGTGTSGTFVYGVRCQSAAGCTSERTSYTVVVNPQPSNAAIAATPTGGTTTNIPAGGSDTVTVCEGVAISGVVSGCPVTVTPGGGAPTTASSSGQISIGGSTPVTSSSSTNTFTIPGTLAAGTYNFTVICTAAANSVTCSSAQATTLIVTVLGAPVSPTAAYAGTGITSGTLTPASRTASVSICQNNPITLVIDGCTPASSNTTTTSVVGTNSGAILSVGSTTNGVTNPSRFSIPNDVVGTFSYTLVCTNEAGCSSLSPLVLNVTVNSTPTAPTLVSGVTAGVVRQICKDLRLTAVVSCPTGSTLAVPTGITGGSATGANTLTITTATVGTSVYTLTCISTSAGSCPSPTTSFTVKVNDVPATASLTAVGGSPASATATATTAGALTICQFQTLRVNTNCLVSAGQAIGTTLSVTGVNSTATGTTSVPDGGTASAVGGIVVAGGTTPSTFASYLLPTATSGSYVFTVVCQNESGCISQSVTSLSVTVNGIPSDPMPVVSSGSGVLPNLVVCETTSGVLSITTGCRGSNVSAVVTATGGLTAASRAGLVTGTNVYTISTAGLNGTAVMGSVTFSCSNVTTGCSSTATSTVSVTINAAPVRPGTTISQPSGATLGAGTYTSASSPNSITICQGQPVSLTVDGCQAASGSGGSQSIGGSGTGFVFSGTGFVFTPTGPTTSTATVTDGNLQQGTYTFQVRCRDEVTFCESLTGISMTMVVTGQPSTVAQSGFAPTCVGGSSVTGTLGCSVGFLQAGIRLAGSTSFTTVTSPVTLPAVSGNYTVTAVCTTGGACLGTPLSFTVNNLLNTPAPTTVRTVQNAICLGQSTTLVAGCPTAGSTAIWYITGTNTVVSGTALSATSLLVTPVQQGQYSYQAVCTDPAFACASAPSTAILLDVLPGVNSLPTISAQPNPTVAGAPVTLTGAGCTGTTIFYIQGTNTEVGRGMGGLVSVIVNPQVTTIYDAVCSNGQCTSNRTTGVQVFVTPCNFVATVTPSSAVICSTGGSVQLTASGGVSYVWNNGQNTQQITVSAAGIYQVVVTSSQGCTAVASATVTTGTAPSPTITGNTTIFAGQSTTLTAGGGGLYAWNGPGLAPNAGGAAQVVSQAGVYMVTVTSPTGCTASANVTVTVSALPGAPTVTPTTAVAPSAPLQACVGQTIQLVASCPTGSMPRFKMGAITNDAATQNVTGNVAGLVTYQVVCVAGGQEGPATAASINFNTVPTVQILQTGVLCNNQPSSVTLSATGASSYTWSTGATTQSIVVNAGAVGLYSVNGMQGGCVGTATQMVMAVACSGVATPFAISGATIDCVNGNVTIAATGGNGNQIQYSIGGVQYQPSNPVALDPAFQNNAANTFVQLFVRQVNSTSTGFDIAGPFQFNFRAICPVPTPPTPPAPPVPTCGSPANTIGQPLVVTGVTDQNCLNGTFRILTTGGNGSAIDYSVIVGISNADPLNCIRRVDNAQQLVAINSVNSTIAPFQIDVSQNGVRTAPFFFDFKAFCTGTPSTGQPSGTGGGTGGTSTTPPATTTASPVVAGCGSPANTVGQPLTITGVDQVNCQNGTFRILTTGGNGATISYADIVGVNNMDPYNCVRVLDNPSLTNEVNTASSTVQPFQLRVRNIGGSTSNTYVFNMKQVCTGSARVARTEGTGNLDVTVLGNPTLGETVEVEVRGAEGQALQLRLVDGLGTTVSEKSVEKAGSTERQTIGLGRSAGMYFLQVTTPDKSKTVKVVRQ